MLIAGIWWHNWRQRGHSRFRWNEDSMHFKQIVCPLITILLTAAQSGRGDEEVKANWTFELLLDSGRGNFWFFGLHAYNLIFITRINRSREVLGSQQRSRGHWLVLVQCHHHISQFLEVLSFHSLEVVRIRPLSCQNLCFIFLRNLRLTLAITSSLLCLLWLASILKGL